MVQRLFNEVEFFWKHAKKVGLRPRNSQFYNINTFKIILLKSNKNEFNLDIYTLLCVSL